MALAMVADNFTAYQGEVITTRLSFAVRLVDNYTKKEPIGNIKVTIEDNGIKVFKNPSGYYFFTDLVAGKYTVTCESDFYFLEDKKDINTSKIKVLDIALSFYQSGPAAGATSIRLKDASKLKEGDAVEFRKPGAKEQRVISKFITATTISWSDPLDNNFNTPESIIIALKNPVVEINLRPAPAYPFPENATLVRGLVIWGSGKKKGLPVDNANIKVVGTDIETITDKNGEFVLYFSGIDNEDIVIEISKESYPPKPVSTTAKKDTITVVEGETLYLGVITFPK